MNNQGKVLACVDRSRFAEVVGDYGAWAARKLGAPLEFLHVIDTHAPLERGQDHSGAIGVDAQENLLKELSAQDEVRSRALREGGRRFLNDLRQRALAAGLAEVDVRQRHGTLEETLSEQQDSVTLFILGRRGASADITGRDLGRNLEWAVRAVQRPVLAVTDRYQEPSRVLLAFDGSAVTRNGVELIAASKLLKGLPIHLLMAGKPRKDAPEAMAWATRSLAAAGLEVSSAIKPGDPERVIAQAASEQQSDLLVMGAYSHSPLRALALGSRTTDLLRSFRVATLLLR